jgi:HSP20 family protein
MNETVTVKRDKDESKRDTAPAAVPSRSEAQWPSFTGMRGEVERLFDQFARSMIPSWRRSPEIGAPLNFETAFGFGIPAVEVVEKDKEFQLTAELPGMEARDVEISVSGDVLTIKGEKKEEKETKEKSYYLSERRYGSFQRSFQLPGGADAGKISAKMEKGVLSISMPKSKDALNQKRTIPIVA